MKRAVLAIRDALASLLTAYARLPRSVRCLLPVAWAGGIWWASSQSSLVTAEGTGWTLMANGAHFVIFGILSALVFLASDGADRRRRWLAVVLTVAYAVVDELHQSQVPGRAASIWDVGADGVGALWFTAGLSWLRGAGRGSRLALWVLLPVGLAFVALATFG